ncbi:DUF3830 family protein [Lachnospiraceae bacterium 62-35]
MKKIKITSGEFEFIARLEEEKSPETSKWLLSMLPWTDSMVHVSWSGQACFFRLGDRAWGVPYENPLRYPSKGEVLVYPGNKPELQMGGELYFAWGSNAFSCDNGNLSGNHVMTIEKGLERLKEFGEKVHFDGKQETRLELLED